MEQHGTAGTPPMVEPDIHRIYRQDAESQHPSRAEPSTYQSRNPKPSPPREQKTSTYSPSRDPSLQLPPIKSVDSTSQSLPQLSQAISQSIEPDPQPSAYHPSTSTSQTPEYTPSPLQAIIPAVAQHVRPVPPPLQPALTPGERSSAAEKHRKDIKRRTKSGCLTCRKRRIKCDEVRPVCRNCLKSKRECAGYDPIFKLQSAPLPHYYSTGNAHSSRSTPIDSTPEATYGPISHGYTPTTSPKYGLHRTGSYSPDPVTEQRHDYRPIGDSTLAANPQTAMSSGPKVDPYRSRGGDGGDGRSSYNSTTPEQGYDAKRTLRIDDLYMIGGADPPTPKLSQPISSEMLDQIRYLYTNEYGKGMNQFLETTWYTYDGLDILLSNTKLCEMFAGMLELFTTTKNDNYETMRLLPLTESRMTWLLMTMPRHLPSPSAPSPSLDTVLRRLTIFEHLITARRLASNPLVGQDPNHPPAATSQEHRKQQFWRELGHYATLDPSAIHDVDASLGRLRLLLDQTENRDVLYSMAVVRRYGLVTHSNSGTVGYEEGKNKLLVAKKFVEDEAAGKGTTQVVQRLCGMAVRSWAALR